jgi:hypothetical protein
MKEEKAKELLQLIDDVVRNESGTFMEKVEILKSVATDDQMISLEEFSAWIEPD